MPIMAGNSHKLIHQHSTQHQLHFIPIATKWRNAQTHILNNSNFISATTNPGKNVITVAAWAKKNSEDVSTQQSN